MSAGGADPKKRVLVIDDNPVNLRISAALIRKAGFVADTAETAEAGLDRLAGTLPDLIVTDLQLPGMDGLELTRTVKKDPAWKHIPVILLTAAHSRRKMRLRERPAVNVRSASRSTRSYFRASFERSWARRFPPRRPLRWKACPSRNWPTSFSPRAPWSATSW